MQCGTLKENGLRLFVGRFQRRLPFCPGIGVLRLHAWHILLCDDYVSDCKCKNSAFFSDCCCRDPVMAVNRGKKKRELVI